MQQLSAALPSMKKQRSSSLLAREGRKVSSIYMKAKRVPPSIKGNEYWDLYLNVRYVTHPTSRK
jgi:hypothetical protein